MEQFIIDYAQMFPIDKERALRYINDNTHFETMTEDWYRELRANNIGGAYKVYNDDYYFTDMWNCFKSYSRLYLMALNRQSLPNGNSIVDAIGDPKVIVDLGCGVGYCTSMLKAMFPRAKVYGTNLKNTKQWMFCEQMAHQHKFTLVESIAEVPDKVDFVFASEYFEHIQAPVDHIQDIVTSKAPNQFVIANAFNTRSIGHFETYVTGNTPVDQSVISKQFNMRLRQLGYTKVRTTLFNNKPSFWSRSLS